jgi:hypothetical protein
MHTHIHTCTHAHTHTYTLTHIHTHTRNNFSYTPDVVNELLKQKSVKNVNITVERYV